MRSCVGIAWTFVDLRAIEPTQLRGAPDICLPHRQEYNEIASRSFVSRHRWDSGMQSEPIALLRLSRAYAKLVTSSAKKEFCGTHNVRDSASSLNFNMTS